MRVAFYNVMGYPHNGEQETLERLRYAFQKQGHELIVLDRDGYIENRHQKHKTHIENTEIDVLFTFNGPDYSIVPIFDQFSVFFHWAPIGFFENYKALLYLEYFQSFDSIAYSCEKNLIEKAFGIQQKGMCLFGPSVPKDYALKPSKLGRRKLFYIGINFERALVNMRYGELLGELDKTGQLDIYGPKEVYGRKNLWAGFQSYKGEIPFDGKSIIEKINRAGVCLALNSPMHNDATAVTSRTYEGTAAGAVIISDDNEFVRKYFGDSVFYIDRDMSEKDASKRILEILDWVNAHPEEAYEMACRSQQVFLEHLTLDKMVSDFIESTKKAIARVHDRSLQTDIIDVVCFVDNVEDYPGILSQLQHQYYQNLHLILVTDKTVYEKLNVSYPNDFVQRDRNFKGRSFVEAKKHLLGRYFMFVDKHTVMHARHIYKNYEVLSRRDELFAYSGSYLKRPANEGKKYIILNSRPIMRDEFLLFSTALGEDAGWDSRGRQCLHIETIFSQSAALFDRKILQYVEDEELSVVSKAVHYYLACCSLIKADRAGWFTYTLTTGYSGNSVEEMSREVFGYSKRHQDSNSYLAKTCIRELNEIFFKYTFESNPNSVMPRNLAGEITWSDEVPRQYSLPLGIQISNTAKGVRWLKRIIPAPAKDLIKKMLLSSG